MKSTRTAAYLLLLLTVLVWGATFTLVKSALRDVSPLLFNLLRFTLATLALAIVNRRHLRSLSGRHLRQAALAGFFLALGYQLQTLGLAQTDPAKSAFLTGLVVIFVPALMLVPSFRPSGSARPHGGAAVGAVFAFFGLILITTPATIELRHLFSNVSRGDGLTLPRRAGLCGACARAWSCRQGHSLRASGDPANRLRRPGHAHHAPPSA